MTCNTAASASVPPYHPSLFTTPPMPAYCENRDMTSLSAKLLVCRFNALNPFTKTKPVLTESNSFALAMCEHNWAVEVD